MIRRVLAPSISRRVFLALLLSCGLVWAALYGLGWLGVQAAEVGNFDREVRLVAGAAADLVRRYPHPAERAAALQGLAAYIDWSGRIHGTPQGFLSFRVVDAEGAVLAAGDGASIPWPGRVDEGFSGDASFRWFRASAAQGLPVVEVASSKQARQQLFDAVMLSASSLSPLLYVLPLVLLPAWLAVRKGLMPLQRLSRELAARSPDDLSPVRVKAVYRELTPLIAELDGAFRRVSTLLHRERNFLADAAHELRTPLAVMLAQADTLRSAAGDEARRSALRRLDDGLLRASRLVNQLLALARLDAEVGEVVATVDLADLVRDCLAMQAHAARTRGIELSYSGPDNLVDRCCRNCVESILDNLVGNAVRYGHAGGRVEVALSASGRGALQLAVRDDGPGIPAAELPRLFERFRRGAAAVASGSGLGLAIVRSAARQMAARIEVCDGLDGRGIGFCVEWPATGR